MKHTDKKIPLSSFTCLLKWPAIYNKHSRFLHIENQ